TSAAAWPASSPACGAEASASARIATSTGGVSMTTTSVALRLRPQRGSQRLQDADFTAITGVALRLRPQRGSQLMLVRAGDTHRRVALRLRPQREPPGQKNSECLNSSDINSIRNLCSGRNL